MHRRNPVLKTAFLLLLVSVMVLTCSVTVFAEANVALTPASLTTPELGAAVSPSPSPTGTGPLPVITKSPTDETVNEGGHAEFVAKYQDAIWAVWHFLSPDGQTDYDYKQAKEEFEGLQIIDGNFSHMVLKKIPYSLNGWRVYCEYTNNNGSSRTDTATITVVPKVTPTPAPTPTPSAAPEGNPGENPDTETNPGATPALTTPADPAASANPDTDSGITPPPLDPGGTSQTIIPAGTPTPVSRGEKSGGGTWWKTLLIILAILLVLACVAYLLYRFGLIPAALLAKLPKLTAKPATKPAAKTEAKTAVKTAVKAAAKPMTRTKGKHEK